jgi:hypothetical protein
MENELALLQSLGFEWPSPAYIAGAIVFGLVGIVAFRQGRKKARDGGGYTTLGLGLALMFFPYLVSRTWLLYIVGAALCLGLYLKRD